MDIYNTINYMKQYHKTIYDLKIRVTYYVRVSTLKEEQDSSVENQISYFEKMISEHQSWVYVNGYIDRIRGESVANRESFMRMIEDSREDQFDLILTKEVSRFARNTIDSLTYTRELLRCGVGVFFLNDNICTVDSDAEFRLTIMSSIAQDEVRKMSERIKFGHKQSIQKGVVMGNSRIYGYDKKDGKLVVNEKEAEMVKYIFEQYASGLYALRAIERQLYDMGYRSRNGNKIQHNTIKGIITNPKYKGYYCGNKVKIADYRTKEQIFLPEEEWIVYKDESGETVPAIVEEDLWNRANALFKQRSEEVLERGRGKKTTSVLSGKIVCTHHNAPFWRTSYSHRLHRDENIYQWICREKKRGKSSDCPCFAIYENEIYDILRKCFIQKSDDFDDYVKKLSNLYIETLSEESFATNVDKLKNEQKKLKKKKEVLLDLYMDDSISRQDFKERNETINKQIAENEKSLRQAEAYFSPQEIEKKICALKNTANLLEEQSDLSKETINELVGIFVDRIEISSVDENNMEVNVVLNIGEHKNVFNRNFGLIFKKMLPKQQLNAKRIFGRNIENFTYSIFVSIIL